MNAGDVAGAELARHYDAPVDGCGQDAAAVVVGVVSEDLDPARSDSAGGRPGAENSLERGDSRGDRAITADSSVEVTLPSSGRIHSL